MTDAAVVSGSLVDVKNINTHKVVRLSIDIPAEQGAKIVEAFGWPTMVEPVSVAVARLDGSVAQRKEHRDSTSGVEGSNPSGTTKPKSYAQRAGILTHDPVFRRFIGERWDVSETEVESMMPDDVAGFIRYECEVTSRSEIIEGTEAGRRFRDLEAEFKAWKMVDA